MPRTVSIRTEFLRQGSLTAEQRAEMWQLLCRHFEGVTREQFAVDLSEKNWVLQLRCGLRLVGFSTLLAYESHFEGAPVSVIYSGDTIVAREAWGSCALARAWIGAVKSLRQAYPNGRYYWLLLTSGFRTYRFLPVFWREFFPRCDAVTPRDARRLQDHLAEDRFGNRYHPETGIVRFATPQRLCRELQAVPAGRITDPHIAYFLERNPGHASGDELVCLTELTDENLTPAGRRMAGPRFDEPVHLPR